MMRRVIYFLALVHLVQCFTLVPHQGHPFLTTSTRMPSSPVPRIIQGQTRWMVQRNMVTVDFGDDDEVFRPYEETEEDIELEKEMARELFDELRASKPSLPVADFMAWEDIVDVMSTGVIDEETMQVIIEEVGIKDDVITFDQFYELVDLVNQVAITFGEEMDGADNDDDDDGKSDEAARWILDAMNATKK